MEMKIGEKRPFQIIKTPGPGDYLPERADSLTKSKSVSHDFGKNSSIRTILYNPEDSKIGPGQY